MGKLKDPSPPHTKLLFFFLSRPTAVICGCCGMMCNGLSSGSELSLAAMQPRERERERETACLTLLPICLYIILTV